MIARILVIIFLTIKKIIMNKTILNKMILKIMRPPKNFIIAF